MIIKQAKTLLILIITMFAINIPVFAQINDEEVQTIFLLGRGLGKSYYYLVDTLNKSKFMPFNDIKYEYIQSFQNLNISDVILKDLNPNLSSNQNLNTVRFNLYSSLLKNDLNQQKLECSLNSFTCFYDSLLDEIQDKYSSQGRWLLNLSFYLSFQQTSINSENKEKYLLSGFHKITEDIPFVISKQIDEIFKELESLDKLKLTTFELELISENINEVNSFFSNYNCGKPFIDSNKKFVGYWQGVMINPENEKYDINLEIYNNKNELSGSLNIDKLAYNINIEDINFIKNYFTLTFSPFGTEKLYVRFNGKVNNDMIDGEVIDILGEKGNWILAKSSKNESLPPFALDNMISCLKDIENKLQQSQKNTSEIIEINNVEKFETNKTECEPIKATNMKNPTIVDDVNKMDFYAQWITSFKYKGEKYKLKLIFLPAENNLLQINNLTYKLSYLDIQGENIYFNFNGKSAPVCFEFYGKLNEKKNLINGLLIHKFVEYKTKFKKKKRCFILGFFQ